MEGRFAATAWGARRRHGVRVSEVAAAVGLAGGAFQSTFGAFFFEKVAHLATATAT